MGKSIISQILKTGFYKVFNINEKTKKKIKKRKKTKAQGQSLHFNITPTVQLISNIAGVF